MEPAGDAPLEPLRLQLKKRAAPSIPGFAALVKVSYRAQLRIRTYFMIPSIKRRDTYLKIISLISACLFYNGKVSGSFPKLLIFKAGRRVNISRQQDGGR